MFPFKVFLSKEILELIQIDCALFGQIRNGFEIINQKLLSSKVDFDKQIDITHFRHHSKMTLAYTFDGR
jgi:hypothetical protein